MGGLKSPILAVVAALFVSAAGAPAPAAADSPVDPAAAVRTVQQSAEANRVAAVAPAVRETTSLANSALDAPAPPAIRETVDPAGNRAPEVPGPSADPTHPAVTARPASHPGAAPAWPVPSGGSSHDRRLAPAAGRHGASTSSPPRGRKATPPARSAPERAVGSRPVAHPAAAVPAQDGVPGGTGTTIGAGSLLVPNAIFFVALLIVALLVSRWLDLRPLEFPVPAWRRLAFVTPAVPPG